MLRRDFEWFLKVDQIVPSVSFRETLGLKWEQGGKLTVPASDPHKGEPQGTGRARAWRGIELFLGLGEPHLLEERLLG